VNKGCRGTSNTRKTKLQLLVWQKISDITEFVERSGKTVVERPSLCVDIAA